MLWFNRHIRLERYKYVVELIILYRQIMPTDLTSIQISKPARRALAMEKQRLDYPSYEVMLVSELNLNEKLQIE